MPARNDIPENASVLDELARLLAHPDFAASERQRRLLTFLCTEVLEGRGDALKAYTVGTMVLGRTEAFDPQTDSIVRVEVGRLRRVLELHYALNPNACGVSIIIPKGSYRPLFVSGGAAQKMLAAAEQDVPVEQHVSARRPLQKLAKAALVLAAPVLAGVAYGVMSGHLTWRPPGWARPAPLIQSTQTVSAARQIIVVPTRVESDGRLNFLASQLVHLRLTERLTKVLTGFNVTAEDRADNESDIDLVLRTTVWISPDKVTVNYLLIDADRSDIVTLGNVVIELKARPTSAVAEAIIHEVSERVARALDLKRVGLPSTGSRHWRGVDWGIWPIRSASIASDGSPAPLARGFHPSGWGMTGE